MIKRFTLCLLVFAAVSGKAQTDTTDAGTANGPDTSNAAANYNIPVFSTSGGDVEGDLEQQDVSSLLMSSKDVFTQFASFQFNAARYRMRGYPAENQQIMINGVNVNNLETGFSSWSSWGGLNDVTRYIETRFGITANRMGFSGPGGYTNIDSRASSFRKGTRVSYSFSNRVFAHRFMLTHSTGLMKNGWAVTASVSDRYGNQVYIPGTYFDGKAFYLSVDKRISDKHLISFTGFGAPIEQGRANAATMETYKLAGTNYYNDAWGYQNGKVRNASVSRVNRPQLQLSHVFNANDNTKLTTTLFTSFGKSSLTGLNYYNAPVWRPDYYKYLPSYYYFQGDTVNGDVQADKWATDVNTRQINWDQLIAINQANLYSVNGYNTTETRSRYILENRVEDMRNYGLNMVLNKRINKIFLSAGLNGNIWDDRKYKVMEDLLGGSFWLDVDQFAENLGVDPTYAQNDIDNPNKLVRKGDRFGYDYSIHIRRAEAWAQAEYSFNKLDVYFGITLSDSKIWREGHVANGKFPTNSKGNSEKLNFFNYGVKGGLTYKLSGRQFVTANFNYMTRTPEAGNIFIAPRVRNDIVSGIRNEEVLSGDVNYIVKYPGLKIRLTYYYTQINHQTWVRTYWNDLYNNNVDLIMKGVNQTHQGVELGIEKKLFISHVIQGAFSFGQYVYTNRPTLEAWQDNNGAALFSDRTVYLKNYKVGGTPQLAAGIGYKYNGRKFWYAGIYFNYFDQIYIEPNPDRRTAEAVAKYIDTEQDQYNKIIGQERLPSYFTVNLNAGKSFRIKKNYLRFNLMVNNLLNNKNIRTTGYEQLRWDYSNVDAFPPKYFYMQGITYMAGLNFTF